MIEIGVGWFRWGGLSEGKITHYQDREQPTGRVEQLKLMDKTITEGKAKPFKFNDSTKQKQLKESLKS